ncbi:MAG TPA: glycosyltransferase [Phycisphaerales bacterium]|nr:glycosyltransferase [Phycisphaerales bacterium]
MRIALFYHSLLSDWNHGNAHFLRGYAGELLARGHQVKVYEKESNWSLDNLLRDHGPAGLEPFHDAYPTLRSTIYSPAALDLDRALDGVDLIIAHEWNDHDLIARLGKYRALHPRARLLFHDTHHRAVSQPDEMARYDLSHFDGALVFGEVLRKMYLERQWVRHAWTWHEAADTRVFRPLVHPPPSADVLWIGNWGDEERTQELEEFLIKPVKQLGLKATVHGVRYPDTALAALKDAGIRYGGWLSNAAAPAVYARHRIAIHVPRRYYTTLLPGIPTIRVFEALACGAPLVSAPWPDCERLFTKGDYASVTSGDEMARTLRRLLDSSEERHDIAARGLKTVLARHTCSHRVDELMEVCRQLGLDTTPTFAPARRELGAAA